MQGLYRFLKRTVKKHSTLLARLAGLTLLSKQQTKVYLALEAEQLRYNIGDSLMLPSILSTALNNKQLFAEKYIQPGSAYVWRYEKSRKKTKQLRNGSLQLNSKVLDLGFGNSVVAKDLARNSHRDTRSAKILIAPWSYYWTGYFDYIFFVALTISRIKHTLPPAEFADAVVCYPLFHTSFEREISSLLGVKPENIIDSRETEVLFSTAIIGNIDNWFYPNKQDILEFKALIENNLRLTYEQPTRLYIQRAGRRKVSNEAALISLLKRYDFRIIEDVPRTFAEQAALYHSAAFIIGPHGASFANVLWCQPNTELFELFPSTYMPEYFRYLAHILGLRYSAYCYGEPIGNEHHHVNDDVFVDLDELEQQLAVLLPKG